MAQGTGPEERSPEGLSDLLPHRAPMVLLNGVRKVTSEECHAWMKVEPGAWYLQPDGSMPAWYGLELMAQTIAAFSGNSRRLAGRPPGIGFLLGAQSYKSGVSSFLPGSTLEIEARLCFHDTSGLGAFECAIHANGERLASSTLKVYEES